MRVSLPIVLEPSREIGDAEVSGSVGSSLNIEKSAVSVGVVTHGREESTETISLGVISRAGVIPSGRTSAEMIELSEGVATVSLGERSGGAQRISPPISKLRSPPISKLTSALLDSIVTTHEVSRVSEGASPISRAISFGGSG